MEKNQLIKRNGTVYRVLAAEEDEVLLIDCMKKIMPKWYGLDEVDGYEVSTEKELLEITGMVLEEEDIMPPKTRQTVHKRFNVIAGILPFVSDDRLCTEAIKRVAEEKKICMQTVRNYLCQYLAFQNIAALVSKERGKVDRELTEDEKNIRWTLNKVSLSRGSSGIPTR